MSPTSARPPVPPARLLVRGVNWLGDAVMTTPALMRLREALPDAEIALLTHEKLADLWTRHPAVNRVLTFSGRDTLGSLARRLKAERFDTGLALPNSHRSALELWMAGIPRRVGYAAPLRSWWLTQPVPRAAGFVPMRKRTASEVRRLAAAGPGAAPAAPPEEADRPAPGAAHHMNHYLRLAAALGASPEPLAPCVRIVAGEIDEARRKFSLAEAPAWLGLNPGAEYGPAKRWPEGRFIAAAAEIQRRTGCRWLIFGGPADGPSAGRIVEALAGAFPGAPPRNLAGRTSLRELCALLASCRLLLTNDTGPMHVAAAVGTPVVSIFGSTSPRFTGPGLPGDPRHRLVTSDTPCAPCFLRECPIDFRCMEGIAADRVVRAALEVLL